MRQALSVTLDHDNVLWLKGQAGGSVKGTVSDVLDRLVTRARSERFGEPGAIRSVAGTIDLPDDDSDLQLADAYVREAFGKSLGRPILARERPPTTRTPGKRKSRG
jgi:hypothetical protein